MISVVVKAVRRSWPVRFCLWVYDDWKLYREAQENEVYKRHMVISGVPVRSLLPHQTLASICELGRAISAAGTTAAELSAVIESGFKCLPSVADFEARLRDVTIYLERESFTDPPAAKTEVYGLETVGDLCGWLEVFSTVTRLDDEGEEEAVL